MLQARIPPLILIFFVIDLALGTAYVLDYLAGRPYGLLTRFLDLGRESNLPTWYSSIQWFSVATLLAVFAHRNFRPSQIKSWPLLMLPLVFLAFSLDEVAVIHERLGHKIDVFFLGTSRQNTAFFITGIWMFAIGVPFAALFGGLILSVQAYFRRAAGAPVKMLLGMAITLAGAIGIETLYNFIDPNSVYSILQILSEEVCEMLGGTMTLWGSYELLYRHGFALRLDKVEID